MPATTHLLYLHGFRSSPQSTKARQVAAWIATRHADVTWCCPQLPPSPREAINRVDELTAGWPRDGMAVIGSSLGGFYAAVIAERTDCPAVLLNPAPHPARDLAKYVGEISAWHSDERFFFRPEFVDELRAMAPPKLTRAERYFAIVAKGDEVLDWLEMVAFLPTGGAIELIEGGDHAIADFDLRLPGVMRFLGLA
ncbi:MAG: YqiA/YcfP family alpha/beta fold hydrolase [Burkholderiaceae bacterium]